MTANVSFGYKHKFKQLALENHFHCCYCSKEFNSKLKPTIEHVKPHSKGGANKYDNYLFACDKCNNERGNKDLFSWITPEKINNVIKALKEFLTIDKTYVEKVQQTFNKEAGTYINVLG